MFKSIKRLLVAATAILVLSAPPAAFALDTAGGGGSASGPARAAVIARVSPSTSSSLRGFHWGDAGIGAAGVLALMGIGAGATLVVRRRVHQPIAG
jgi:hypothetical protein